MSVACVILVLISVTTIIIGVFLYVRRKRRRETLVDNVAYLSTTDSLEVKMDTNMAYSVANLPVTTSDNEAYGITISANENKNILTSTNEAYTYIAVTSDNKAHNITSSTSEAYEIETYSDGGYVIPDIATSNDPVYDYARP